MRYLHLILALYCSLLAVPVRADGSRPSREEAFVPMEQSKKVSRDAIDTLRGSKARGATKRESPRLKRGKKGTRVYEGHAFRAIIRSDGQVDFYDRIKPGWGNPISLAFDWTDQMYRRHGEDPYRAEKAWFLQQTKRLRLKLERRDRKKRLKIALKRLRGRLIATAQHKTMSAKNKRQRFFSFWKDCANDSAGRKAKKLILSLARKYFPQNSEYEFTREELARFPKTFNPYKAGKSVQQ